MQAVILAAGRGTRMNSLTLNQPKLLLKIGGKNFLEHIVSCLPSKVDELIIVIGYLGDKIRNYFGAELDGRKVTYVLQESPHGTAHALSLCEEHISGRFLVLMGDDLYSKVDVAHCLENERSWLVKKVSGSFSGGRMEYDDQGDVLEVKEGRHVSEGAYVSVNMFVLTPEYFQYDYTLGAFTAHSGKIEYGLPQVVAKMAADYPIKMVEAKDWRQVTDINDLQTHDVVMKKKKQK